MWFANAGVPHPDSYRVGKVGSDYILKELRDPSTRRLARDDTHRSWPISGFMESILNKSRRAASAR